MKKLDQKYIDVLEELDWSVSSYTDDGRVEIESWSPAGEDLCICLEVEDFPRAAYQYYIDFDIDEHIEMWVMAKYHDDDGHMKIPYVRTLVHDAEQIEDMLKELADELAKADRQDV